ncbi:MAG TPA: fatty acid desaturase [Burkholderiales bacterium]|nr:fatty acid desaturase [Burkholderiales bacterium]
MKFQAKIRRFRTVVEANDALAPAASREERKRDPSTTPSLSARLMRYHTPKLSRGVFELVTTGVPFVLIWWAMQWSIASEHVWLYWALLPFAVGFLVRLFLIQHDCGHQAFVPSRRANDWIGRCLGVFTLTAYQHWKRAHAIHHATSGNLDRRGVGDIDTLTVAEYAARPRLLRWRYRLYRNPLVMLCIGPAFVFLLQNRVPAGFFRAGWRHWASTLGTDAAIVLFATLISYWIGFVPFLKVHGPIMLLSATVGGWLFYVQHQFENTSWSRAERWEFHKTAMYGSSHYHLPAILRWFTANIGMHHAHHLCSRIPFYRLPLALDQVPELQCAYRLTLLQSFRCMKLTLWDEGSGRLVSFREAEQTSQLASAN